MPGVLLLLLILQFSLAWPAQAQACTTTGQEVPTKVSEALRPDFLAIWVIVAKRKPESLSTDCESSVRRTARFTVQAASPQMPAELLDRVAEQLEQATNPPFKNGTYAVLVSTGTQRLRSAPEYILGLLNDGAGRFAGLLILSQN